MRKIKDGIVFSDDIKRILKGCNALDFNYVERGIKIPSDNFLDDIRNNFSKNVRKIFDGKVTILNEDEMLEGFNLAINDIYRDYPHCFFG